MTYTRFEGVIKKKVARRALPAALGGHPKHSEGVCFMPCPAITILVDLCDEFTCQLCCCSKMDIFSHADDADQTFHIMPCGHIAGRLCLEHWSAAEAKMNRQFQCPFCRLPLQHPVCGHRVQSRPLRRKDVGLLPQTLPEGGKIGDRCRACTDAWLKDKLRRLKSKYTEARSRLRRSLSVRDEEEFLTIKAELEDTIRSLQSATNSPSEFKGQEW